MAGRYALLLSVFANKMFVRVTAVRVDAAALGLPQAVYPADRTANLALIPALERKGWTEATG